jgi:hypothetical protein
VNLILLEEIGILRLAEVLLHVLVCLMERIGCIWAGMLLGRLKHLLQHVVQLDSLLLFQLIFSVELVLVEEFFSSASHVKEATFTAVSGPFDANSCLCCEVCWVDWPSRALGICKECLLVEFIEAVEGSKSFWRSCSCCTLLLAFPLKASCVGELLVEGVFVDHASIELWLGISSLECLLPLVSLILELMGDHLVVLLQLVEVLVEFSL